MSSLPDPYQDDPGDGPESIQLPAAQELSEDQFAAPPTSPTAQLPPDEEWHAPGFPEPEPPQIEPPQFLLTAQPRPSFPNLLDVALVGIMLLMGFFISGTLTVTALHFHVFGVTTVKQALTDIHYTLGSQVVWYFFTFFGCLIVFPLIWHTGFFHGVEWRPRAAFRLRWQLFSAAFACFILAIIDGVLIPGPREAPIDEVFKLPGAAWLLFLFGITLAPFFEELGFRGFLLPAFCNAFEWVANQVSGPSLLLNDSRGWKRWPVPAVVIAALVTVIPVASLWLAFKGQVLIYGLICFAWLTGLGLAWLRAQRREPLYLEPAPLQIDSAPQIELPLQFAPETGSRWTVFTMALMSLYVSIPFALMHGEQTGYSFGPFILLVCVSLVLCWVRLRTRSLAASTMVHASYNLLLFSLMFFASGGFHHLDKM